MPSARINGIDLYYEVHGEGPPVLLAHGVGSNHLHWWQQIPLLSRKFQVITFDHRGFGFSTDDGRGPDAFVDDVTGLLDHLSIGKVAVVGQSMGGMTVSAFASNMPQRVSALALSCSGGGMVPVKHHPSMKGALEESANYLEFSKRSLEQDGFQQREPDLYFLFASMAQLNRGVDMKVLPRMRQLKANADTLAKAGIPVLLIGGEDDNGANDAMRSLHASLPKSEFHIIPDAGHLLFFERAQAYNAIVDSFLGKVLL
jgi:pimeloyl-ACP methyl ester carboxylesterase